MKKVLLVCLALIMVMSMTLSVFAAPGAFYMSPSLNPAPTLVDFDPADDECVADLIIIAYINRDQLPAELKTLFEKAYADISGTKDITALTAELAALVAEKKLNADDLAISDLFDAHVTDCADHDNHHNFDVTLSSDTLKNFVALLHMNKDGVWEIISDAEVTNNGTHLEFTAEAFSPFAIVVDTGAHGIDPSPTGDNSMIGVYSAVMAASAAAFFIVLFLGKKQKKEEN